MNSINTIIYESGADHPRGEVVYRGDTAIAVAAYNEVDRYLTIPQEITTEPVAHTREILSRTTDWEVLNQLNNFPPWSHMMYSVHCIAAAATNRVAEYDAQGRGFEEPKRRHLDFIEALVPLAETLNLVSMGKLGEASMRNMPEDDFNTYEFLPTVHTKNISKVLCTVRPTASVEGQRRVSIWGYLKNEPHLRSGISIDNPGGRDGLAYDLRLKSPIGQQRPAYNVSHKLKLEINGLHSDNMHHYRPKQAAHYQPMRFDDITGGMDCLFQALSNRHAGANINKAFYFGVLENGRQGRS